VSAQARSAEAEAPSTDTAPPLVEIKGLTKHFDIGKGQIVHAVDDVSFSIAQNEIVGLVGESGSGKSTLGKTLLGLHDKTAGEVIYHGNALPQRYSTTDFGAYATRMQMIFQDPYSSLNPRMTAGQWIGAKINDYHKNDVGITLGEALFRTFG